MSAELLWPGYTQVDRLGVGARSTIFHVRRDATGELFALKQVLRDGPADDRFIEQAENEFRVASTLDHPALRRCYEMRRQRNWLRLRGLLILMEYVEGVTLESDPPGDLWVVMDLFEVIADALHALHEAGHVHADIKPNNILLQPRGGIKIIDFGQSCPIGHIKRRVQGTPDFIAPEQAHRRPIDRCTDVFNLGATMYWVVTGAAFPTVLPSRSRARGVDIATPRHAEPPHARNPSVPRALSNLIMDCCKTRPQDRPADMPQLRARLAVTRNLLKREGEFSADGSFDGPKGTPGPPGSPADSAA